MKNRKETLDQFAKQMRQGVPFSEDFIDDLDKDVYNNSLLARNLSEDTLANELLKDTNISIPDNKASISKKEDFLNRMMSEKYPELKDPNIRIGDESYYQKGGVFVREQPDILKQLSDTTHETAHKYDDNILNVTGKELDRGNLRKAKSLGMDVKGMDPTQAYEILGKSHHAEIPNLREGTFGLGALKSYLKSGKFKSIPIVGPALGLASAAYSGDSSAAIPLLNEAEGLGPEKGSIDDMIENPKSGMTSEQRKRALEMLLNKQEKQDEI